MTRPDDAFPALSPEQVAALVRRGTPADVAAGDVLFQAGDRTYDFVYLESAEVAVLRPPTPDDPHAVEVARHGPGRFLGEWNMLTGQTVYLTASVVRPGRVHRIAPQDFRRLMAEDAELSDLVLTAFLARRSLLQSGAGATSIEVLGSPLSRAAHELRTWAASQRLVHTWFDIDEPAGRALAEALGATAADLPVVVTPTATLRSAAAGDLAELLGLSWSAEPDRVYDVVVVGAGPAGLAAAVYGASEGLDTVLLDAVAVGGQAAASSRIENYLGFPSGVSGGDLTGRGLVQAQKFGAQVSTPCPVQRLHAGDGLLRLELPDGSEVVGRSVVVATGAAYRTLPLERWADFEGAGIYYAATEIEARSCADAAVAVVGGANSAGQAAIYLADRGSDVHLVVRGQDLRAGMSHYLVERVSSHPRISVRAGSEVVALHGGASLDGITVRDRTSGATSDEPCAGLFCFIGATPATGFLGGQVALDPAGYVLTDNELDGVALGPDWVLLGRRPLPFETSLPGVFAAGDVRRASMKRVAAAVGEGSSAIRSVHQSLAPLS